MLYVCYRCEYIHGYKPPVEEVALHCLGTIGDVSCKCSVWSNRWPEGQLQASALIPLACQLLLWRRWGTAVLSYNCTFQQLNLSSNTQPKCCCC